MFVFNSIGYEKKSHPASSEPFHYLQPRFDGAVVVATRLRGVLGCIILAEPHLIVPHVAAVAQLLNLLRCEL